MIFQLQDAPLVIDNTLIDALTANPFRYPRPPKMKSTVLIEESRKRPGIPFTYMLEFVHGRSVEVLAAKFVQSLFGKEEHPASREPLILQEQLRLRPWMFQVRGVLTAPSLESTIKDQLLLLRDKRRCHEVLRVYLDSGDLLRDG